MRGVGGQILLAKLADLVIKEHAAKRVAYRTVAAGSLAQHFAVNGGDGISGFCRGTFLSEHHQHGACLLWKLFGYNLYRNNHKWLVECFLHLGNGTPLAVIALLAVEFNVLVLRRLYVHHAQNAQRQGSTVLVTLFYYMYKHTAGHIICPLRHIFFDSYLSFQDSIILASSQAK